MQIGKHVDWQAVQASQVTMVALADVVVVDLHCVGDARAWRRQALWYVPCAGAVRGVCC